MDRVVEISLRFSLEGIQIHIIMFRCSSSDSLLIAAAIHQKHWKHTYKLVWTLSLEAKQRWYGRNQKGTVLRNVWAVLEAQVVVLHVPINNKKMKLLFSHLKLIITMYF